MSNDWAREYITGLPTNEEGLPVASRTLDKHDFPFLILLHDEDTGELLWEATVTEPGALKIPGLTPHKVRSTIVYLKTMMMTVTTSEGETRYYHGEFHPHEAQESKDD